MTIDYANFTPYLSYFGGVILGLSVTFLYVFNGRIAGISSVLSGALRPWLDRGFWQLSFVFGMLFTSVLWRLFFAKQEISIDTSIVVLIFSGILVGFGSRYGSGCTSGHGICGIARLSKRSIIATFTFMAFGMLTVYLVKKFFL
ncbi:MULTISPECIES: YeeE/YedE family protein [Methylotenera]|uniref:YeeE/YedE family protein n=1 Tax=Methylotenera TaxID=359407 RepID=UPI00037F45B9|nr:MULTISPECIES: YeeE/YedE thiosulfate transporter family protein [Methylotenera]